MKRVSEGGVWWANPTVAGVLSIAPAVLALFLQIHQLTLHDVLRGVTFSADGTNFGSALLLSSGHLPYDNFTLAQPPGMTILLMPFAWIAHITGSNGAFAGTRVVTALISVANVFLVGFLTRQRGFAASIVAGVTFAVYPYFWAATASVLLEPWLLFFCLLGLVLAFPNGELTGGGRLIAAGVLLGYAVTIKPWAIVPAAAVLICSGFHWRETLARFGGGLLAGIVVPCLLFFLAAPGAFWNDVVVAELRGGAVTHGSGLPSRLAELFGLGAPIGLSDGRGFAVGLGLVLAAAVIVLTVARLSLMTTLDWVVLGGAAVLIFIAFIPNSIPTAYGYFAAAFAASVLGTMIGNLLSLVSGLTIGEGVGYIAAAGGSILFVALSIAIIAVAVPKETTYERAYFINHGIYPVSEVQATVPIGACAVSNNPSVLIVSNRLLGQASGCPDVVDPAGVVAAAGPPGTATVTALGETWTNWLNTSHFMLIEMHNGGVPWGRHLTAYFRRNYSISGTGSVDIYTSRVPVAP